VLSKLPTRFAGGIVFTFNGRPLIEAKPGRFRLTMLRPYDREWSRACRAAGLSGIRPHDTRHTFASDFVMKTGNLFALTKLCGWSDYKMVERTYGHLTEGFMENEMKLMNGAAGEV
jgi:integrase